MVIEVLSFQKNISFKLLLTVKTLWVGAWQCENYFEQIDLSFILKYLISKIDSSESYKEGLKLLR